MPSLKMEAALPYVVQPVPGRGLGLKAATDIMAGAVVLSDLPILLASKGSSEFCSACLRTLQGAGGVSCALCGQATFCSGECEAAARGDPGGHCPAVCRVLAHLETQGLGEEEAIVLRFLIQAQALFQASGSDAGARGRWEAFARLSSTRQGLGRDCGELHRRLSAATAAAATSAPGSAGLTSLSLPEIVDILAKEELNGYGIMAPSGPQGERRIRGTAIYPQASLLNHECLPNVARFDDFDAPHLRAPHNTAVHFRALHDLPAGEELTQSYFPLHISYPLRQQRCAEQYGFQCTCPRCKEESTWPDDDDADEWEPEEAMDQDNAAAAAAGEEASQQQVQEEDPGRADAGYIQVFLLKYVCPQPDCFGTMAPVGVGSTLHECNMCRFQRSEAEFLADLEASMQQG